jgi:hypothetical protein
VRRPAVRPRPAHTFDGPERVTTEVNLRFDVSTDQPGNDGRRTCRNSPVFGGHMGSYLILIRTRLLRLVRMGTCADRQSILT